MSEPDLGKSIARFKRPLLYVMGPLYVVAGILHFVAPDTYERVVPPQFPRPRELVYLSGIAEIGLGVGVLLPSTRRKSAWGLVALLAAVFPANVYMATDDVAAEAAPEWATDIARVVAWLRLPLQAVLALWAWWYTRPMEDT
ncbi:hypothetical protein [Haloarchaeobius sp. FL176]|uniref:DoxX family protein n=1 Tax=Haloarchaeobius sp. FL176 TaxID=2967129 RepID=UPI002148AAED|nr:hypothetical protein [Haloarchaeobius sp. FL176]